MAEDNEIKIKLGDLPRANTSITALSEEQPWYLDEEYLETLRRNDQLLRLDEADSVEYFDPFEYLDIERFDGVKAGYPLYISEGSEGKVYAISDELVVKVPSWSSPSMLNLSTKYLNKTILRIVKTSKKKYKITIKREHEIQRRLYEGGVSVPKPEGVFKVPLGGYYRPGLVMERLYGFLGNNHKIMTDSELEAKLSRLLETELQKARALGFDPQDTGLHNIIYNPKLDRLWLIDFSIWALPGIENQNRGA